MNSESYWRGNNGLPPFTLCRRRNQLHKTCVVDDDLRGRPRSVHLDNQLFHDLVVDVRQRDVSEARVEPLVQVILLGAKRCWLEGISSACRLLMHEQFRFADCGFDVLLRIVDPVRHHNFERSVVPFGFRRTAGSRDWTDSLRSVNPSVLTHERPSKTATRATYRFSQLNQP
jgi:hypothetical protein